MSNILEQVKVSNLVADINVRFDADQPEVHGAMYQKGYEELSKAATFGTFGIGAGPVGRIWTAQNGQLTQGMTTLLIDEAYGNNRVLGFKTTTHTDKGILLDGLQSLLVICRKAYAVAQNKEPPQSHPTVQSLGTIIWHTMAVVTMPKRFDEYIPLAKPLAHAVRTRLQTRAKWDPLESTCRHASLSIL